MNDLEAACQCCDDPCDEVNEHCLHCPLYIGDSELDEIRKALAKALEGRSTGPMLMTPLPWRTRLRLTVRSIIDGIAIALVNGGHWRAAALLWKITQSWQ